LVVTDMTMPGITGDKLAIELMKIRQDIPVIICTQALIYKPVERADLAKTVRKVLDEHKVAEVMIKRPF